MATDVVDSRSYRRDVEFVHHKSSFPMWVLHLTISILALASPAVRASHGSQSGAGVYCERCGRECAHMRVTVTDWRTNEKHQYGCLPCAVLDMAQKYKWSRATIESKNLSEPVYLTRGGNLWTVQPETAVAIVPPKDALTVHKGYFVFARRQDAERYMRKHPNELLANSQIIPLLKVPLLLRNREMAIEPSIPTNVPLAGVALRDVPKTHWAYNAVKRTFTEGLMVGTPKGTFEGGRPLTRYEMAVILDRLLQKLHQRGIVSEEALKELLRELRKEGAPSSEVRAALDLVRRGDIPTSVSSSSPAKLRDVSDTHWAFKAVQRVVSAGLMEGYPDGTFRGEQPITRYEIAMVLQRLLQRLPAPPEKVPTSPIREKPRAKKREAQMRKEARKPEVHKAPTRKAPPSEQEATAMARLDALEAKVRDLERELLAAGMSRKEVERALAPLRKRIAERKKRTARISPERARRINELLQRLEAELTEAGVPEREVREAITPVRRKVEKHAKVSSKPMRRRAFAPARKVVSPQPSMLGPTGLLLTPTADVLSTNVATAGFARALQSNITHIGFGTLSNRLELTGTLTAGTLPTRGLLSAKYKLWESKRKRTRIAIGILDAFDEIDTTFYGVATRDISLSIAKRPAYLSLSLGASGGELLKGVFGGASLTFGQRLSLLGEVLDFGGRTIINAGLRYKLRGNLTLNVGSVDGRLSGSLTLHHQF